MGRYPRAQQESYELLLRDGAGSILRVKHGPRHRLLQRPYAPATSILLLRHPKWVYGITTIPIILLTDLHYSVSRLGGPNFSSLPINRGVCPFISTARDGQAQHRIQAGPHYYPNRFQTPNAGKIPHGKGQNYATSDAVAAENAKVDPESMTFAPHKVEGIRAKQRPPKFADDYTQAQLFYNSLSKVEQTHMAEAFAFELGHCDSRQVQETMIERFNEMDHDFAVTIAKSFDYEVGQPEHPNHGKKTTGQQPISMLVSFALLPSGA